MRLISALVLGLLATAGASRAQSNLLEAVKKNPQEAISICNELKSLNSEGISASSKQAIDKISKRKNLNQLDAEILSIYVIGLHCPEVN